MSNIWFTSDLHFNHENILSFSNKTRPWHTVKEMNEALITSWNGVVKHDDTVYVLGDFILGKPDEDVMAEIVTSLNGWTSRYIPRLLDTVFHDLITEEMWRILKDHKNPTINFTTLKHFTIAKIKQIKPEVF